MLSPIMKYHGSKFRLYPWLSQFFPKHRTFVEAFGGAAGVMVQKPRSESEVYNDLDGDVVNVFRVLRDPVASGRLQELLLLTPYSREEFDRSYELTVDPVERARRTLVRAHMGFGSAAATKASTGFCIDSERRYHNKSILWDRYPSNISMFCKRFMSVIIESRPALKVLENHDRTDTLFFLDPPYMHDTRVMRDRCYQQEMSNDNHAELLRSIKALSGMVIICGYDNELYRDLLADWRLESTRSRISAGRGTAVRTENIWMNESCSENQIQQSLFANK